MSASDNQASAGSQLATITELVELIVLELDFFDLLHAELTTTFWRNVIRNSRRVLQKLHKVPVECEEDDPQFQEPTVAATNALIKHDVDVGKPVIAEGKTAVKTFLEGIRPGVDDEKRKQYIKRFDLLWWRYRYGCRFIRNHTVGWPAGYRETHCKICDGFHTKFRFENMHPLLRGLDEMQICFRGYGSHLVFTVRTIYKPKAPRSCLEHVCAGFTELAHLLHRAVVLMQQCQLQDDLFMLPGCTRMVNEWGNATADNTSGITIKEALDVMIQTLKGQIEGAQRVLHDQLNDEPGPFRGWEEESWGMQDEQAAAFGTAEVWNAYVADFPNIVQMFDDAVAKAALLFEGFAA